MIEKQGIPSSLRKNQEIINKKLDKLFTLLEPKENFYSAMNYALKTGGKRIRPSISLAIMEGLKQDKEKVIPFALAIEIIHNMTLVHDDIMDQDTHRRNQSTVWNKYGIEHGINIGDGMFCFALDLITKADYNIKIRNRIFELLNHTSLQIFEGQCLDVNLRNKTLVSEKEYLNCVTKKTGVLISASVSGAAIIAEKSSKFIEEISEYGMKLGIAFQIRDDIIDLTEGKGRDEIGCDVKEGKKTLISIHAMNNANPQDKSKLLEVYKKERSNISNEEVSWVIELFKKLGSIKYAQEFMEDLITKANKAIELIPENGIKNDLQQFSNYIIRRVT
ncbi:MAG: polyprenyl synthetase family protein [Candidatus Ranarchaeia archaeon]